jgi:hypothetical protein
MFSNLAYGAQGLEYYTYWTPSGPTTFDGPITSDGVKTGVYDLVKTMNAEIKGLSPVFLGAEVISVGHTGSLPSGTTAYANSAPINSLTTSGSDGAVVSRLTNGDNEYLVVVNRDIDSTMTLNIGLNTSKTFTRVSKDGSETAISGGTVSYTVEPADIVILKWSNATTRIPGDANLDGMVDVGDLGILAANYGGSNKNWLQGDFNGDGLVDVGDLGILAANYGGSGKTWAQGDFNGDGMVDVGDLGILAANYGTGASGTDFDADYAKVFGTESETTISEDTTATDSPICSSLGLSLIAGLTLMGLMLVKLEE